MIFLELLDFPLLSFPESMVTELYKIYEEYDLPTEEEFHLIITFDERNNADPTSGQMTMRFNAKPINNEGLLASALANGVSKWKMLDMFVQNQYPGRPFKLFENSDFWDFYIEKVREITAKEYYGREVQLCSLCGRIISPAEMVENESTGEIFHIQCHVKKRGLEYIIMKLTPDKSIVTFTEEPVNISEQVRIIRRMVHDDSIPTSMLFEFLSRYPSEMIAENSELFFALIEPKLTEILSQLLRLRQSQGEILDERLKQYLS